MARKKANPAQSLSRFMHGIYDYYTDRGMPSKTAKARMVDHTLETCVNLMKQEKDVPDELLVLMTQWTSRALNNRGAMMTKAIRQMEEKAEVPLDTDALFKPLRDIKQAKDAMDVFIENYKGWSELDGTKKEE